MKQCRGKWGCNKLKNESEFDGCTRCRSCEKIRQHKAYIRRKVEILERHKKWIENNRKRHNEIVYNYELRNNLIKEPGKYKNKKIKIKKVSQDRIYDNYKKWKTDRNLEQDS